VSEVASELTPAPPDQRRGWMRFFLRVALILGGVAALLAVGDRRLKVAIARLDAEEPGWRFEDLEAARRAPTAERNLALVVLAAERLPAERDEWRRSAEWFSLEPVNYLPKPNELKAFREHAPPTAPAHAHSLTLRDYPSEYYLLAFPENPLAFIMPRMDQLGRVAAVLEYDAVPAAVDSDPNRAIRPAHAILNAGRSIGDEPSLFLQYDRTGCGSHVARTGRRTLAWSAPAEGHAELQAAFLAEAGESLILHAARCCRAVLHKFFEGLEACRFRIEDIYTGVGQRKPGPGHLALCRSHGPLVPGDHADTLLLLTAAVALSWERFRRQTGRCPADLDEIPKSILAEMTLNPCDDQPIRYPLPCDHVFVSCICRDERVNADDSLEFLDPDSARSGVGARLWNPCRRGLRRGEVEQP